MAQVGRRLARPNAGYLVLLGLAAALLLILFAAYHGSDASTASQCAPARSLLRRISNDTAAARTTVASTGAATPSQARALQGDDDAINNFLNAEQSPDNAFNSRALPVSDELGRVVTDLQGHGAGAISDLNRLDAAVRAAGQYCHAF